MVYIAEKVGAQPWIDYSKSYILYNYKLNDKTKGFKYSNLSLIRKFVGSEGESGFILTHVEIAA